MCLSKIFLLLVTYVCVSLLRPVLLGGVDELSHSSAATRSAPLSRVSFGWDDVEVGT